MSKFASSKITSLHTNHEGQVAEKLSPQAELATAVLTSFIESNFYEKQKERLSRIKELAEELSLKDPTFLIGLAIIVRQDYNMRTASHILIGEVLKRIPSKNFNVSDFINKSVVRVDDLVEIFSYILPYGKNDKSKKNKIFTHAIKKGLKNTLSRFNEYELAKYNREGNINLRDLVRLSHLGTDLAGKVVNGSLATPNTWEVKISALNKKDENYPEVAFGTWEDLFYKKNLGYMATLRNLRNILKISDTYIKYLSEKGVKKELRIGTKRVDSLIDAISKFISDTKRVKESRQLPFAFYSAYNQLKWSNENTDKKVLSDLAESKFGKKLLKAIETAATASVSEMKLEGSTAVFADVSKSMELFTTSKKSKVRGIDIGLLFLQIAKKLSKKSVTGIFGDIAILKDFGKGIFDANDNYEEGEVGYATHAFKIFDLLISEKKKVDTILLFTDCQVYGDVSEFSKFEREAVNDIEKGITKYKESINPDVRVVFIDLAGYGSGITKRQENVYTVSSWSEKVFEQINAYEDFMSSDSKFIAKCRELGNSFSR